MLPDSLQAAPTTLRAMTHFHNWLRSHNPRRFTAASPWATNTSYGLQSRNQSTFDCRSCNPSPLLLDLKIATYIMKGWRTSVLPTRFQPSLHHRNSVLDFKGKDKHVSTILLADWLIFVRAGPIRMVAFLLVRSLAPTVCTWWLQWTLL
jgi:hypothetical protein